MPFKRGDIVEFHGVGTDEEWSSLDGSIGVVVDYHGGTVHVNWMSCQAPEQIMRRDHPPCDNCLSEEHFKLVTRADGV